MKKPISIMFLIILLLVIASGGRASSVYIYAKYEFCHLQDRVDAECAKQKDGVYRSLIDCIITCENDVTCSGVSLHHNNVCFHHQDCVASFECDGGDEIFNVYTNQNNIPDCQNDGTWNYDRKFCKCINGWVGEVCERLPISCSELLQYDYSGELWANITPTTYPQPFRVHCSLQNHYVNTFVMSNLGWYNFNKTMEDYKQGFYFDDNHYWVGLDKMKAINEFGHDVFYLDTVFEAFGGVNVYQYRYENFQIVRSNEKYTFTFQKSNAKRAGPARNLYPFYGNCLGPLQEVQFSAWDTYNNLNSTENCAAAAGVGWWFQGCDMVCNPLGYKAAFNPGGPAIEQMLLGGLDCANSYSDSCRTMMYFVAYP